MSKAKVKYALRYASDIAYGGAEVKAGTEIGEIELPAACNPVKIPDQLHRGVLQLVDVEAEEAATADAIKAEKAAAEAKKAEEAEAKKAAAEAKKAEEAEAKKAAAGKEK